ncbi:MarR family winged helix-turn-helix transcriptional regulator [Furfurilactobacillus siliginis]|uniref:HTH marR-type domain-containing protein n=1 Tax=Furfurilactobacillus siliginis TaxID=348151 RepID=A0A0R2L251_9LACO|nr:helix-turn-helix domain-containing protein [Furfurilactobacillus siliginis]KRN93242.1 hypothetical protein IV55_GL001065 [Furfurilactobacillus siliginis]GEK29642.1 hypothetical protein LSI01_19530 [Furfurilactobacillus siliginis]
MLKQENEVNQLLGLYRDLRNFLSRPIDGVHYSVAELSLLSLVSDAGEEGCSPSTIADFLGWKRSQVSQTISSLLKGGLIEERVESRDRRRQRLYLTKGNETELKELIGRLDIAVNEFTITHNK